MKDTFTILIVDDEPLIQTLLKKILTREGYNILLAQNGQEAIEIVGAKKVDIVLSDMDMPGMNGMELLKNIKKDRPEIGVVMMTGAGDLYTVKDAIILGADEYITKPFENYEISRIIERTYWRILAATNTTSETEE